MVQEDVLESIDSDRLVVYAVWEPILRTDDERSSRKASALFPDSRARHYWTDTQDVGKMFQGPIDLRSEPAWDVYLVYPPGVLWDGEDPPKPVTFMHQLVGRLPEDLHLDGDRLGSTIRRLLSK